MSDFILNAICIVGSVIFSAVVFQLIRKRKLREEYGLLWMGGSILILLLSCIVYPLSLVVVLLGGLPFALAINLFQSVKLSAHQDHIRDLAQYTALLEWRLQQLEGENASFAPDTLSVDPSRFVVPRRESVDESIEK